MHSKKSYFAFSFMLAVVLAGCTRDESPQAAENAPPPRATALFVGDSITTNWKIQELVPQSVNAGVAGQNSNQIRGRVMKEIRNLRPRFVHILAGTNDDIRSIPIKAVGNVRAMALEARQHGAQVVIGTIPPYDRKLFWQHAYAAKYNSMLKDMARAEGFEVADYYAAMVADNDVQRSELFMVDGIHPNAAGYAVMEKVLRPHLRSATDRLRPSVATRTANPALRRSLPAVDPGEVALRIAAGEEPFYDIDFDAPPEPAAVGILLQITKARNPFARKWI